MDFQSAVDAIVDRANTDSEFCERLMADPRGAIEQISGVTIPSDWQIEVTQGADGAVTLSLANEEIPDAYLALISGGEDPVTVKGWYPGSGC
jgi:hypothetical protein